jgi:hypothetical protein
VTSFQLTEETAPRQAVRGDTHLHPFASET